MFCRKCGKQIPDDSDFCSKCGTRNAIDVEASGVDLSKHDNESPVINNSLNCPVCGTSISPSLERCPICGARNISFDGTRRTQPSTTAPPPQVVVPPPQVIIKEERVIVTQEKKDDDNGGCWAWGGAILFFLYFIGQIGACLSCGG